MTQRKLFVLLLTAYCLLLTPLTAGGLVEEKVGDLTVLRRGEKQVLTRAASLPAYRKDPTLGRPDPFLPVLSRAVTLPPAEIPRFPVVPSEAGPGISLRGVITGASPMAIIAVSGKSHLLRIGETVAGRRLSAIFEDHVILTTARRRDILRIGKIL